MKKILFLSSLTVFICVSAVFGKSNGKTVLPFLEMPAGARYIAMGSAGTAVTDDSTAMFWNPGALAKIPKNTADLMHSVYVEETYYDYASFALKIGEKNAIGFSFQYFSYGDIDTFDHVGRSTGELKPKDMAASAAYAADIGGFGFGAAVKFIRSELADSADTVAFDFGIASPGFFGGKLYFGAAVANMSNGIKYDKVTEDMPLALRFGAGYYILPCLLAAADIGKIYESDVYFAAGAEYILDINDYISVSFRAGYNTIADTDDLTGFSAGFGFGYKSVILDYAFVPMGNLGDTHRISFTFFR